MFKVPSNLTTDPNNRQGETGSFHGERNGIVTLLFADDETADYDEEALIDLGSEFGPENKLQLESNYILSLMARGKIDMKHYAKKELERRGRDILGKSL